MWNKIVLSFGVVVLEMSSVRKQIDPVDAGVPPACAIDVAPKAKAAATKTVFIVFSLIVQTSFARPGPPLSGGGFCSLSCCCGGG
jgi:hypothetical protein